MLNFAWEWPYAQFSVVRSLCNWAPLCIELWQCFFKLSRLKCVDMVAKVLFPTISGPQALQYSQYIASAIFISGPFKVFQPLTVENVPLLHRWCVAIVNRSCFSCYIIWVSCNIHVNWKKSEIVRFMFLLTIVKKLVIPLFMSHDRTVLWRSLQGSDWRLIITNLKAV